MSMIITELQLEVLRDHRSMPLKSRDGKQLYKTLQPFIYASDIAGTIVTPAGFITDLGSVPRLPFIYALFGDDFQWAAVVHDYLYSTGKQSREVADKVLREAAIASDYPNWKAHAIYIAVRTFGASRYSKR